MKIGSRGVPSYATYGKMTPTCRVETRADSRSQMKQWLAEVKLTPVPAAIRLASITFGDRTEEAVTEGTETDDRRETATNALFRREPWRVWVRIASPRLVGRNKAKDNAQKNRPVTLQLPHAALSLQQQHSTNKGDQTRSSVSHLSYSKQPAAAKQEHSHKHKSRSRVRRYLCTEQEPSNQS